MNDQRLLGYYRNLAEGAAFLTNPGKFFLDCLTEMLGVMFLEDGGLGQRGREVLGTGLSERRFVDKFCLRFTKAIFNNYFDESYIEIIPKYGYKKFKFSVKFV